MERNEPNEEGLARRKFLIGAAGAGAIGAVAALLGRTTIEGATVTPSPVDPPAGSGYRETEHIRKYYYCARYW